MNKKLKISRKVKYTIVANGCSCTYATAPSQGNCRAPLFYACSIKTAFESKGDGLHVKRNND